MDRAPGWSSAEAEVRISGAKKSLEKHLEHPDGKIVEALEAQAQNVKIYFSEIASPVRFLLHRVKSDIEPPARREEAFKRFIFC